MKMDQKDFAVRYSGFTSLFLQKFAEKTGNGNMVFSPFSILSLLSILADATGGSTGREVQDLLQGEPDRRGVSERLKERRTVPLPCCMAVTAVLWRTGRPPAL